MPHPLLTLARRVERTASERRAKRALTEALHDPHLARDIGRPYQPRPKPRVDRW